MIPPEKYNIINKQGGFTAVTTKRNDTLWRPASILKGKRIGELIRYKEDSFYQNNNDVTTAFYKIKGYPYRIVVWFDNKTHRRIE